MKKFLLALTACLTLTFSTSTASAKAFDDSAYSSMSSAYGYAVAAYNENPTTDGFGALYYAYYSLYYLYYGAAFDNDTLRFYGYTYASNAFTFASNQENNSRHDSSTLSSNVYAAFYYSYIGQYFAYFAYQNPFSF